MLRSFGPRAGALVAALVAGVLLTACGDSDDDGAKPSRADAAAVATTYADLVLAAYDASIASTEKLRASIDAFTRQAERGAPASGEARPG